MNTFSDYQYMLAYTVFIVLVLLFIKTRFGYVTVYYALVLFSFVLVLLNANKITLILKPLTSSQTS